MTSNERSACFLRQLEAISDPVGCTQNGHVESRVVTWPMTQTSAPGSPTRLSQ